MAARRRRMRSGSSRRTTWATFDDAVSVATGGTHWQTNNMLTNYTGAGGPVAGITVLRTHIRITQTSAATAADRLYFGIVRGQNEDVGADTAGAVRPLNDFYADWAFWAAYTTQASTGAGPTWGEKASNVLQLDLRARRKLPELQMSWNYVLQQALATTSPATYRVSGRVLIALP